MKMPIHFATSHRHSLQTTQNKPHHNHIISRFFFIACTLHIATTHATTNNVPQQLNPINMLTGGLSVETELNISKRFSIGPLFTNNDYDFSGNEFNVLGYGIRADWYFAGNQTTGAFLSPFAKVWAFDTVEGAQTSLTTDMIRPDTATYGALLGYNWIARSFRLRTSIGWAISSAADDSIINYYASERKGLWENQAARSGKFLLDFGIGWSF